MPPRRQPPPITPRRTSTRQILPRPPTPATPSQQLDQIFQSDPLGHPSPESSLVAVTVASLLAHPRPTEAASDRLEAILQDLDPQDRRTVETGLTRQSSTLIGIGQEAQRRGRQEEKNKKRRERDAEQHRDVITWLDREWPGYLPQEIRTGNSETLGVKEIGVRTARVLRSIATFLKPRGINPDLLWETGGLLQVAVAEDFARRSRNQKDEHATLQQRLTQTTVDQVWEAIQADPESVRRSGNQPRLDDNDANSDGNYDNAFVNIETPPSGLADLSLDDNMAPRSSKKRSHTEVNKTFRPGATPIEQQIQYLSYPELEALEEKLSSELKGTRDEKLVADTKCAMLQGLNIGRQRLLDHIKEVEQGITRLSTEDNDSHDDSAIGLGGRTQNSIMPQELTLLVNIRKAHVSQLQEALSNTAGQDYAAQLSQAQQGRDAAAKAEAEAESRVKIVKDIETLWLRNQDWLKATEDYDAVKQGHKAMQELQKAAQIRVQEAEARKRRLSDMLEEAETALGRANADLDDRNRALSDGEAKCQESGKGTEKASQDLTACIEKLDQEKAMALLRQSQA